MNASTRLRAEYIRRERGTLTHVIYKVFPDGREIFSGRNPYEVRWYRFQPSRDTGQEFARSLPKRGSVTVTRLCSTPTSW